jgi:hypothetical protein
MLRNYNLPSSLRKILPAGESGQASPELPAAAAAAPSIPGINAAQAEVLRVYGELLRQHQAQQQRVQEQVCL